MASAHVRRSAIPEEMLAQQGQVSGAAAEFMKDTPMFELYQRDHRARRPKMSRRSASTTRARRDVAEDFLTTPTRSIHRGLQSRTLIVCADG